MIRKVNRECPDCGCEMYANMDIMFCSYPPVYEASCCCGHYEFVREEELLVPIDMESMLKERLEKED